jgi:hypothetical protein
MPIRPFLAGRAFDPEPPPICCPYLKIVDDGRHKDGRTENHRIKSYTSSYATSSAAQP